MESTTDKPVIITGYLLNDKIYLLTKEETETFFNYLLLKKECSKSIPLEYILEILKLNEFCLPLTEFYNCIDAKGKDLLPSKSIVDIVITNTNNYLINVNRYLSPLAPGFYLLFNSEPSYEYSLRCVNNRLTVVIAPSSNDDIICKLVNRIIKN